MHFGNMDGENTNEAKDVANWAQEHSLKAWK